MKKIVRKAAGMAVGIAVVFCPIWIAAIVLDLVC